MQGFFRFALGPLLFALTALPARAETVEVLRIRFPTLMRITVIQTTIESDGTRHREEFVPDRVHFQDRQARTQISRIDTNRPFCTLSYRPSEGQGTGAPQNPFSGFSSTHTAPLSAVTRTAWGDNRQIEVDFPIATQGAAGLRLTCLRRDGNDFRIPQDIEAQLASGFDVIRTQVRESELTAGRATTRKSKGGVPGSTGTASTPEGAGPDTGSERAD